MLKISINLFFTGIILGTGPCLATCGPIIISYIAGTKRSPLAGLRSWFVFSITRIIVYLFLGFIAGFAGAELFSRFYWQMPGYIIWFIGGIFISFLGILIYSGKESRFKLCRLLNESFIQKDTRSLITLGALVGVFPCVPLAGVLSYITMMSTRPSQGMLMAAAFGAGTLISPLIFIGILAGGIPRLKLLRNEKNLILSQKICGVIMFLLGAHIIIKTSMEYLKV